MVTRNRFREIIMRYWIFDKDSTPQRFPLQRLIRRVREIVGNASGMFEITEVRGYGVQINEWKEKLDTGIRLVVPLEELDRLSLGTEEWFYDLDVLLIPADVRFGLHDSTALFVEAAPCIAEQVACVFTNIRIAGPYEGQNSETEGQADRTSDSGAPTSNQVAQPAASPAVSGPVTPYTPPLPDDAIPPDFG